MFTPKRSRTQNRRRRIQRGQSIVVALLVLLLLGLAGALFVTIIARNLINARHANRVVTADQYARAGITYADAQLSSSQDGADWRPALQFQLATPPIEARELARYNAAVTKNTLPAVNPNDPDLEYLQVGYSRYNTGAGRYLIRVTYDPVNIGTATVPPGKYLKIESIGREGVIDPVDPTTYTNNRSTDRTQSYQVAFKPIGITDYARFETNPDKRSDIANLGVISEFYASNTDGGIATPGVFDFTPTTGTTPVINQYPILTTYGAADAYTVTGASLLPNPNAGMHTTIGTGFAPGGGSIHANMPLRFFGTNVIYLNYAAGGAPSYQDTAEVAGDLLLDNFDPSATLNNSTLDNSGSVHTGQQSALILNPVDLTKLTATPIGSQQATTTAPAMPPKNTYIAPSNSPGGLNPSFDTQGGLVRDGSMQNDTEGLPRGVTRLEPPLMDAVDSASQLPRYRAIAMNSAPRANLKNPDGTTYVPASGALSASQYGYGKDIYINNPTDIQPESASIGGGTTLTDEWLHGNNAANGGLSKGNWNGLFYSPPGVSIVLGQAFPSSSSGSNSSSFTYGIRLTRSAGSNFVGPDGVTNAGPEMDVNYSDLDSDPTGVNADNDIIIYAEGNVRVRGILSPNEGTGTSSSSTAKFIPRHITIVTDGTAYIEGNLLKGTPDSSISVIAHDYVCVNTSQFLAGSNVEDRTDGSQNPIAPTVGDSLSLDAEHSLLQEFNFGLTGAATPTTEYGSNKLALYISAGPAGNGSTTANFDILDPITNTSVLQAPPVTLSLNTLTHLTYDLSATSTNTLLNALSTDLFQLSVSKNNGQEDSNGVTSLTDQDVSLERVAILPMDIRIEAVLYAQTRSFFVIPGEWFNTNSSDNLLAYFNSGTRPDVETSGLDAAGIQSRSRFPMYGQPIDLKITIEGTVSEAHPADIAAQSAWMQKWGWIPQYHGNLVPGDPAAGTATEAAGHQLSGPPAMPAIGLQIIYDPQAGYPYDPLAAAIANRYYLRSDQYGRPLPFTPKLPVSTGLLYSGESGEAPLLQ